MHTHHGWCVQTLVDGSCCCTMSLAQSAQALLRVPYNGWYKCRQADCTHDHECWVHAWKIIYSIGERLFLDAHMPFKRRAIYGCCCLLLVNIPSQNCTSFGWWSMPFADIKSLNRCTHTTDYACMPWMIMQVVVWLHLIDAHTPHHMLKTLAGAACNWTTSRGRCMQATTDLVQLMRTCHDWCVQSLADRLCNWSISPFQCA